MTHDLPTTFSSFADRLLVDRRLVVGSRRTNLSADGTLPTVRRRTAEAQTADKRQIKRHFADTQTADCRRFVGGQTNNVMKFFMQIGCFIGTQK